MTLPRRAGYAVRRPQRQAEPTNNGTPILTAQQHPQLPLQHQLPHQLHYQQHPHQLPLQHQLPYQHPHLPPAPGTPAALLPLGHPATTPGQLQLQHQLQQHQLQQQQLQQQQQQQQQHLLSLSQLHPHVAQMAHPRGAVPFPSGMMGLGLLPTHSAPVHSQLALHPHLSAAHPHSLAVNGSPESPDAPNSGMAQLQNITTGSGRADMLDQLFPLSSRLTKSDQSGSAAHYNSTDNELAGIINQVDTLDSMNNEEIKTKIECHQLTPVVLNVASNYVKDPTVFDQKQTLLPASNVELTLESFLKSQGINPNGTPKSQKAEEFQTRLKQLQEGYEDELANLNQICEKYTSQVLALLKSQSTTRPISEKEKQAKIASVQQRFDYLRTQLRQNVCNAIVLLQKHYNQAKKKRRSLSKKATETLNNWFFSHLNDPYPSDEEKMMLASLCSLTLNQVNNWFGNKRIRYKRKCLEEEAKRSKQVQNPPAAQPQQPHAQNAIAHPQMPPHVQAMPQGAMHPVSHHSSFDGQLEDDAALHAHHHPVPMDHAPPAFMPEGSYFV